VMLKITISHADNKYMCFLTQMWFHPRGGTNECPQIFGYARVDAGDPLLLLVSLPFMQFETYAFLEQQEGRRKKNGCVSKQREELGS